MKRTYAKRLNDKTLASKSEEEFPLLVSDVRVIKDYYNALFILHSNEDDRCPNNRYNMGKVRINEEIKRVKKWLAVNKFN